MNTARRAVDTTQGFLAGLLFAGIATLSTCTALPAPAVEPVTVQYYWATWCAPCHKVERMVTAWADGHPEVRIVKVNFDSAQGKSDAAVYRMKGVPDLRIGDKVYSPDWIGGYAKDYLDSFLEESTR